MQLKHLLIIPDGNRRWAKKNKLQASKGHQIGATTTRKLFQYIANDHPEIKYCSFWAMSKDNFEKRTKKEINFLIKLIHAEIKELANDPLIAKRKVNIRFYGAYEKYLDKKTIEDLHQIERRTAGYINCYVSILLIYNGKDELINGLKQIKNTKHITEQEIKANLWTGSLPNVDLIVRTGVEDDPHLSGNVLI